MSLIAFSIRIVSAAIAFVSQILLARWIGQFEYGIFVLVWTAAVIAGNLSCFGFHTTIIRFAPQYFAESSFAHLRGLLLTGRLFAIVSASLIALAGMLGVSAFSGLIENYYVAPFYLGMLALPMIALGDTLDGTARANAWPIRALSPTYIIRPVLILATMIAALQLGYGANAKTAIISAIIATYATTLFQLITVTYGVDKKLPSGPNSASFSEWFAVSLPIFFVEGFLFLLTNADVLVVGHFMDPQHVAVYFATVKVLALVHFVYFAVKAGSAQRYSELMGAGSRQALAAFARESASWTFWGAMFMSCVVLPDRAAAAVDVRRELSGRLPAPLPACLRHFGALQRRPGGKPSQHVRQPESLRPALCADIRLFRDALLPAHSALRPVGRGLRLLCGHGV